MVSGRTAFTIVLLAGACALTSCKGGPAPKEERPPLAPAEKKAMVDSMTERLRSRYGSWSSPRARALLSSLLDRMGKGMDVVLLKSDRPLSASGLARHVYVSKGALKLVQYENELAFLMAREAALIEAKAAEEHWDRVGKDGLYDLPHLVHIAADRAAVKALYSLGYDPRGAVSLLQRWNPFPFADDRLHAVRDEIAKLSPMRDPIINGPLIEELRAALSSKGSGDARRPAVNPGVGGKK